MRIPRRSFTEQNLPDNVTDKMIDEAFGSQPDEEDEDRLSPHEIACMKADAEMDRERDERGLE